MSLSFLYPLAWLGAVSVAVPIWLHLKRRTENNLVAFSAMRFLDDEPIARARPLWPRNWWLLLIRCLAVLLLTMACAWPYVPGVHEAVIRESRVYILDNTLSHQWRQGMLRARDEIADALENADPGMQLAVVELTATPQVVVPFGQPLDQAVRRVRELKPAAQRGSYRAAFRTAAGLLEQSLGVKRTIVFSSDSQANQWRDDVQTIPFLNGIDVRLPRIEVTQQDNVSIELPQLRRFVVQENMLIQCAVTVRAHGSTRPVKVAIEANGRQVVAQQFQFSPGQQTLTVLAEWQSPADEWLRGSVVCESEMDELPADNRAFFSLPPVTEGRAGMLVDSVFLRTALSPDVMRGRWLMQPLQTDQADDSIEDLDAVCLESRFLESRVVRELVLDSLNTGRGVVLLVNHMSTVVNGFLRELGVRMDPQATLLTDDARFRFVVREHPLFAGFDADLLRDVGSVRVQRYFRTLGSEGVPLLYSKTGDALMLDVPGSTGRLLVLGFAMESPDTNWPFQSSFVPFIDQCLQYVRSVVEPQTAFTPGEACIWTLPKSKDVREVVLRSAAGREVVRAAVVDDLARFRIPDDPGLYEMSYDAESTIQHMLQVNPPPAESELTFVKQPPQLDAWMQHSVPGGGVAAEADRDSVLALTKSEILEQQIWWWLMFCGLLALFTETVWIALRRGLK